MDFDLAIVGSGSAGFAAAIAATQRGLSVVMVEQGQVGGTCVNVGCIPSKALLAAADARATAAEQRFPGISTTAGVVDAARLVAGKAEITSALQREKYLDLVADYGWELRAGQACFVPGPVLEVDGERLSASVYLVATGAQPRVPPVRGLGDVRYLTSTSALELEALPRSMVVVGGNYVGLELGQLFARLGVEVTLLEALERLAPGEEPELSEVIEQVLADEGVTVRTASSLGEVRETAKGIEATLSHGEVVSAEAILMATGRRPSTAGLRLEDVGVEVGARGEVVVDAMLRTTNPRIWAAGDVTGAPQFVYVAGAHGSMVVENAFGGARRTVDYSHLPRVTFTSPNLASVGMTDAEAARAGIACACRVLPLGYLPRAIVQRDTRGVAKIVAEADTGRVLGIHLAGPGAGDAILAGTYALEAGMTVDQVAAIWAPYLTGAEAIRLAAQSFRTDVAKLSCCAT